ncbi:MAG: hypothetical protein CR994_00955 [Maribacter sp.]|nr:MAG: hypothetical protein CR994_00955 [Maribacter sp.]
MACVAFFNRRAIAKKGLIRGLPRNNKSFFGSIPRTLGSRLLMKNAENNLKSPNDSIRAFYFYGLK